MKKVTSFLLALVMVVSLLPGTAMTVSAVEEIATPTQNNYYSKVIVNASFNNINSGITKGLNGTSADEQYTVQGSSTAQLKTGTLSETGVCKAFARMDLTSTAFDINRGFEVSFVANFNDLVVADVTTGAGAITGSGFIVDVRAASRCRYGFHADAEGNIYVAQYDTGAVVRFDTGADLGDKQVEVRIVADDDMNTSVIVGGRYVGRFQTSQAGNTENKDFLLYTGTMNRVGDNHVNDIVLHDLTLTQAPAADSELQAYYTYEPPCVDGEFDEMTWPVENGVKVAALSDENYLYIAVSNSDPDPDFVINGVNLTADPETGFVTLSNGKWAGEMAKNSSQYEIKIPLKSVLGLEYAPGQKVGFTYTWGGIDGALVLAGRAMIDYEGFDGVLESGSKDALLAKQEGGKLQLTSAADAAKASQTVQHKNISASRMAMQAPVTLEFTADFTDLVVADTNSNGFMYAAGVSVELRADPCRNYGFHADAEGNIYITQRMNASSEVTRVDTGIDVGATNVNVRLVTDETGATTIYVNGVACEKQLPPSTFICPSSGGRGYYQINNSTNYRDTNSTRVNDVTLYNLSLTQDVPAPELQVYSKGANRNADITAYLNPNGIVLDGVTSEAGWYIGHSAAGEEKTPNGMVGISWGDGNLYVGGETTADNLILAIGRNQVVADLRAATAVSGTLAVSNTGFEWVLPLSRFGLNEGVLNRGVAYEVTLDDYFKEETSGLKGTLTFSGEQMLLGETGRNYADKDYLLSGSTGHVLWNRSDNGYVITSEGLNLLNKAGDFYATGNFTEKRHIPVDYAGGAFELEMTTTIHDLPNLAETAAFGMRGLIFEVCGTNIRAVFALNRDAAGNVWMHVRDSLDVQSCDTGVDVGSGKAATFRFSMDDKQSIHLYVNDQLVHAFAPIDRRDLTASLVLLAEPHLVIGSQNGDRDLNAGGGVSAVDVVIHDMKMVKSEYATDQIVAQAALDQLTEAMLLNGGDASDVTELVLPNVMYVDNINQRVDLSWSAIDKGTGRVASYVDLESGLVDRATVTRAFDLKAMTNYNGLAITKTFTFQIRGTEVTEGTVALIEKDDAPAKGVVTIWDDQNYAYLDNTHNSIVVNQGESKAFNRIVLRDSDEYSRVSARHLGVFTSDDGENWKKVTGWLMHQSGRTYTLYNLNATAQYVKVHCYHDDLDLEEGPTFYNKVADMIQVSNETYLPGTRSALKYNTTFVVTNDTEDEQKDVPVYISLAELGAKSGEYQKTCADFRFTIGETMLAHWYNGQDGFYVRVPSIPAKGSTEITAHWGGKVVEDYSDGEATFEVTYGNVSLMNLSRDTYVSSGEDLEQSLLSHGRPFTFPNGEVIVVGRTMKAASNVAVFRSTDGGHTFHFDNMAYRDGDYVGEVGYSTSTSGETKSRSSGFGGFLWDDSIWTEKDGVVYEGRLFLLAYSGKGNNTSDYRITVSYSDDYGRTWSEPKFLSLPGSDDIYKAGTEESAVSWLENADVRMTGTEVAKRAITYCDGLTVKVKEGNNEFNRYVIIHSDTVYEAATPTEVLEDNMKAKQLRNVTTAIYSDDGGQTWYCSDTLISIPGVDLSRNTEDGTTEAGFAQLDDGSLRLVIRAQQEGNYYLYEGISTDYGVTWTSTYSNVLSSNTAPMLMKYGSDRLQLWSACTGLGQTSYRRTPLHLGLSTNNYETFDKIVDLTFATAFDTIKAAQGRKTQTGIAINKEGTSAFVSYHDQTWHENDGAWTISGGRYAEKGGTMGLVIEEFDQMIYGTKGAWDNFENSSLKYQGWLVDADGVIELSREQAVSGKYSMKVVDKTSGSPAHALRQIPSMKSGTVGAKIMVPETNEAPYFVELKAAYNYDHMKFAIATFYVSPAGTVGYVDAKGGQHGLTTVEAGSWNDYALSFDVETGKGSLTVNGKSYGPFNLPELEKDVDLVHGVTVVQVNQNAATKGKGDCVYVDDFFANELTTVSRSMEEASATQSTIGRFMTIVRQIIEMDGEEVELVEWAWVPGL